MISKALTLLVLLCSPAYAQDLCQTLNAWSPKISNTTCCSKLAGPTPVLCDATGLVTSLFLTI